MDTQNAGGSRYLRERLLLVAALLFGLGLLYVSSLEHINKFIEKLTEAIGVALVLVFVMDVSFKMLLAKVRSKDHEAQQLAHEWLTQAESWKSQMDARINELAQDRIRLSLDAINDRLGQIERALASMKCN